jgi:hypothetical protein
MSELSSAEQQKDLQQVLHSLKGLIKNLPSSLPCGAKDGPIGKYFPEKAEYDEEEGPYFTFNKAYDRVFQGLTDPERELLVMRGKYGIERVHTCMTVFSKISGIEKNNGLVLMAARASDLVELCQTVYVMSSSAYIRI